MIETRLTNFSDFVDLEEFSLDIFSENIEVKNVEIDLVTCESREFKVIP